MNLIQNPEISQKLQTLTGIRQRFMAPTMHHEVQPVIVLDDLSNQSPDQETVRRCSMMGVAAAVAGQQSFVDLQNPAGSGVVAVVEQFYVVQATGAGNFYDFGFRGPSDTAQGTLVGPGVVLNTHFPDAQVPAFILIGRSACLVNQGAAAAAGPVPVAGRVMVSTPQLCTAIPTSVVLTPGWLFRVASTNNAVDVTCTFFWTERNLIRG